MARTAAVYESKLANDYSCHVDDAEAHLLVDDRAETGLALHNGVWDTHLLAESRKEDDELDGVDIVGDEDKRSLLVLNETDDVVETVLDGVRLGADVLLLLAILNGGGLLGETLLLLGLGLRAVLVEELESLGSGVAVKDVLELSDRRRDLEAHVQDLALALEADVLGPSHHAREVATGLDVLANTEVAGALLDERVLFNVSIACTVLQSAERGDEITYLGLLLRDASLSLREGWGRSWLLSRLWRLSLRKPISKCSCLIALSLKGCAGYFYRRRKTQAIRSLPILTRRYG